MPHIPRPIMPHAVVKAISSAGILFVSRLNDPRFKAILERFEQAWETGIAPEIGEFIPNDSADAVAFRAAALIELVRMDLIRRWRDYLEATNASNCPSSLPARPILEDYLARYPEIG